MKFHNFFLKLHKSCHLSFLTVIFMTTLACQTPSLDPKFEARAPQNCGRGPDISYPFWLNHTDLANPFCGYPNFVLSCKEQNPVLRIYHGDYIVKKINYTNHSFLLANAEAYKPTTCPTPYNISLDRTPFNYVSNHAQLFFFYNCSSKPEDNYSYPLNCASNGSLYSFATFDKHVLEHMNYRFESCKSRAIQPLDNTSGFYWNNSFTEKLKMGFALNWTAQNCSNCEQSGGRCGFENNEFLCFCRDKPYYKTCNDGKRNVRKKIIIGFSTGFGGIILTCIAFFLWLRLRRDKNKYTLSHPVSRNISFGPSSSAKEIEKGGTYLGVHLFSYSELEEATNKFDSDKELGDGGFGIVYYGILRDGRAVAVKRLYETNYKKLKQFINEIEILACLRHQNLVSLYGSTSQNSRELLLVYEYISNGTVADHIHGNRAESGKLLWPTRMKIAIETASALSYLHASSIIHRDVKTTNILLDQNFCVKVADFGLSRLFPNDVTHVSTAPQGTPGYVDPEYHECYQLTEKSDVYSFGVVLVELISSKPAVDLTRQRHEINLSSMAINKIRNGTLNELVDPTLGFHSNCNVMETISAVAEIAFRCLQSIKDARPSMNEVLEELKIIECRIGDKEKAEEIDISADEVSLLKSGPLLVSPDNNLCKTPKASG